MSEEREYNRRAAGSATMRIRSSGGARCGLNRRFDHGCQPDPGEPLEGETPAARLNQVGLMTVIGKLHSDNLPITLIHLTEPKSAALPEAALFRQSAHLYNQGV